MQRSGLAGVIQRELERVPPPAFYLSFAIAAGLVPVVTTNGYVVKVGLDTLL